MIKSLKISRFKSIRNLELDCRRVNVLIGKPNSGKSNFLESLAVFAATYDSSIPSAVRFEKPQELFYNQDLEEPVSVQIGELSYDIQFHPESQFILSFKKGGQGIGRQCVFKKDGSHTGVTGTVTDCFIRPYYFEHKPPFVDRLERFLWPPNGGNLLSILISHQKVREMVAKIVQGFGVKLALVQHENRIVLQKEKEGGIVVVWPYWTLSDTLQRVVFYYTAIETNKNATLLFEEPESHAFPYYTKFLAENIAMDESNQYFIATHNPYLLLSILEKTPMDQLNVLMTYVENEETRINKLTDAQLTQVLDLGSSVFFNLEDFVKP